MSVTWIKPVTDRTQDDVEYAKSLLKKTWKTLSESEKEEYLNGLKGCLNLADLERIENNIQFLLDALQIDSSSSMNGIPTIPDTSYFEKMKENVTRIYNKGPILETTPSIPELPFNDFQKINHIEKILLDVYNNYDRV